MHFEFDWVSDPASWIALITLIALELVLGVDNIIFISILPIIIGYLSGRNKKA